MQTSACIDCYRYPFGLTQQGISSKTLGFGGTENKKRFNGYEQQNKEFSDGTGLEWYDYKNRFYDNQIGRFFCQDRLADDYVYYTPYQFAGNEVPNAIDLDGLEPLRMSQNAGMLGPSDRLTVPRMDGPEYVIAPPADKLGAGILLAAILVLTPGPDELLVAAAISKTYRAAKAVDKAADAKVVFNKVDDIQDVKKVPNPNGRNGGELHQKTINDVAKEMEAQGFSKIDKEVMVKTPGGNKEKRFVDIQGTNPKTGEIKQVQVGKQNINGTPVSREVKALNDIENATGVRPEFRPYNSNSLPKPIEPIIKL